jgi:translocation and assembly module TamA
MRPTLSIGNLYFFLAFLFVFTTDVNADVNLHGIDGETKTNVELTLSLRKENCKSPQWRVHSQFAKADNEIDEALRALGYYHSVSKKSLTFNNSCWTADFDIQLGELTLVKTVNITITGSAHDDPELTKLTTKAQQLVGAPLNHGQYEKLKSRIQALAMDKGYLHGSFTEKKLTVNPATNTAQIDLVFAAQNRQVFGEVKIDQDILKPEFVNKFILVKKGEFYSSAQLAKTYEKLSQSGYFASIDIQPDIENQQENVPVNIKLLAKKRNHYELGVGYDTDIGPLLSGVYNIRRLNKRGHFLTSQLDLSPVLSTAEVLYNIPLDAPLTDFFSVGAGIKREDTNSYKSITGTLSTKITHAFSSGWKQTLYLDYSYEDFLAEDKYTQTLLLVPGGSWLISVSDNAVRPNNAYRIKLDANGSYKNPLSDVSYLEGAFSGVWIKSLPLSGRFIGRSELGAMMVDDFARLPTTYRFYAGGINSIRGYGYKELGPKDAAGDVIGGQFLAVLSAEYEQSVFDNWGIAGFIDTGNAFNLNDISLKTGAGLGLRWYSPFGPVRIDFAIPLNDAKSSFQIHFAAGTRL